MKIQITLKIKAGDDTASTVELVAGASDTVSSIKEKVADVQLIPFPVQELCFDGKLLANDAKLATCGIADGSKLSLEIKADEATLVQQLSELLQTRDLSADELGLLYCYKHGASINQALKLLGFEGKLQDFVAKQKTLAMQNGSVSVVRGDTSLKPFSAADEIVQILKASPSGHMDIKELSTKFTQKFGVSLASIVGCRPVEYLTKNSLFVVHGNHKQVSLQGARAKYVVNIPSQPQEVTIDAPPGLGDAPPGFGDAPPGLGDAAPGDDICDVVDAQQYVELHNKICGRTFLSNVTQTINDFVAALSEATFLDIDHVVIGGSIGKGSAITGAATAEIVLFTCGLPLDRHDSWMPALLKAVAGTLSENISMDVSGIRVVEQSVKLHINGSNPIDVSIFISPAFKSFADTLKILIGQGPESRTWYAPSLSKERTQFISRQSSSVKATIRLMKWWRDQQQWMSQMSFPSDDILELATIYSAIQTKPSDQKQAIANVMSLLSQFNRLRVVWSNFYNKDDVWAPLLRQRPLLMDPTNPFVNVADPAAFDASELMALAQSTHFFW